MMAVPIGSLAPPVIGAPKALFDAGIDAASYGYDVTADGRRFLLTGAGVQPASGSIEVLVNWGALLNAVPAGP